MKNTQQTSGTRYEVCSYLFCSSLYWRFYSAKQVRKGNEKSSNDSHPTIGMAKMLSLLSFASSLLNSIPEPLTFQPTDLYSRAAFLLQNPWQRCVHSRQCPEHLSLPLAWSSSRARCRLGLGAMTKLFYAPEKIWAKYVLTPSQTTFYGRCLLCCLARAAKKDPTLVKDYKEKP